MDKYLLPVDEKKNIVQQQIAEAQTIIYRNDLENLTFKADGEKKRTLEVDINNQTLKEKLDLLWEEWDRLNNETSSNFTK